MSKVMINNGDLQDIADAIRGKNGSTDTYKPYQMASAIEAIPTGGGGGGVASNDVNFYDYDGTIVNSYSASEFANLTALPANPTHTGLTAQGWNWSLSDAKTHVATYGKLNIGQMYVTDDGATRIYIELHDGRLSPTLGFAINGTATVDWGDGSSQTVTGTSTSTVIYTQHNYASAGNYVISIKSNANINLLGSYDYPYILSKNSSTKNENLVYANAIKKIELGSNITMVGQNAFKNCYSLSNITIPSGVTSIETTTFYNCYSLNSITIPNGVTSIGNYAFKTCCSLSNITIPNGVTSIGEYAFNGCNPLSNITIPSSVTSINEYAFYNCSSLNSIVIPSGVTSIKERAFSYCSGVAYYDFSNHTSVPTLSDTNAFNGMPSDCKIIVPDDLYDSWISASNWSGSSIVSHIVKASQA